MEHSSGGVRAYRGELWALGSVLGFASANIFDGAAVAHDADPLVGPLVRGLPGLLLGLILVGKARTWSQLRPSSGRYIGRRAVMSLLWAGAVSTLGLFAYYFAIQIGGVTITIPVQQTYGIWGAVIAWFLLYERFRGPMLMGLGLIASGLALLSWGQHRGQPISPHWYWAIPLALLTALSYGVSGTLWRDEQLRGAHQSTAILLQFIANLAVGLAGLGVMGRLALILTTPGRDVLALLASGVLSGIAGVYCMFMALRLMNVARVLAYAALTPLLTAAFAHLLLREYLNRMMLVGVLLVSLGVALTQIFRPVGERQA